MGKGRVAVPAFFNVDIVLRILLNRKYPLVNIIYKNRCITLGVKGSY